jgi:hypothetical protein
MTGTLGPDHCVNVIDQCAVYATARGSRMSYKAHAFAVAVVSNGLAICLSALHASPVSAAVLSYEETAAGRTGSGQATSYLSLPTTDTYSRSFNSATTQIGSTGFGFYDDFVFTISAATADAITSTIDFANVLGINNLQTRLYNFSRNPNLPVLGTPVGGAIDAWSNTFNLAPGTNEIVNVLPMTMLDAGTYVLEVRGNVVGSSGGSFSGNLNLVPTPLPAALPLLLSGIGILGGAVRRSRKSPAA